MNIVKQGLLVLFLLSAFANQAFASNTTIANYESVEAVSRDFRPGNFNLDLNEVESVKVTLEREQSFVEGISKLEIVFKNASNLVVTKLKRDRDNLNLFRGIVNDAWIYRQIVVEVDSFFLQPSSQSEVQLFVRAYVVENSSYLNDIQSTGSQLFEVDAVVKDVTRKTVIDSTVLEFQGKRLVLKLFQQLEFDQPQIEARWFGNGEETLDFYESLPESAEPVGLTIEEFNGGNGTEFLVRVRYKYRDSFNIVETGPILLTQLLSQKFRLN